ncbi:MAG: hypothetical protein EBY65_06880, partial [Acidimicrobiia bacterium]|nr:hypothetical protein [Acidimicrobiia bacterium]
AERHQPTLQALGHHRLDVNIYDLEIAHSAEGPRGVVVLVVETAMTERLQGGLMALGYRPSSRSLEA